MPDTLNLPSAWLGRLDSRSALLEFLQLCRPIAFYLVDRDQHLLHWSPGAAQLTGLDPGNTCPPEFRIHAEAEDTVHAGGMVTLHRSARLLYGRDGAVAGGIALLTSDAGQENPVGESRNTAERERNFQGIISRSPAMRNVFQIIRNAAETEATVLVRGESGSGKELVARAIHNLSARRNAPFLAVNCAALSANLLESELFGHVRGAFTGAIKDHKGVFQRAEGGTLFLDEVAELPLELQAKLLRVIQERNFMPVGGDRLIGADVRIVAATHRSLREEVRSGHFREDLMYRLRVVPIFIPPLRERREDISLLIRHFIALHNAGKFRKIEKIDPQAMRLLLDYHWPGNVRELHNVIEYAFAVGRGTTLRPTELPPEFTEPKTAVPDAAMKSLPLRSPEQEKLAIGEALRQSHGRVTEAARLAGMSRATFWRKRKHYGL
ncbi:sigma-54 interaction domain-containing protein [Methylomicrobium album]|uniref:Transcriptional regulator containing PAS, AAA-type ATPase, and DNA-binding domains n=1 Tax=Methylomicrobium album BG8 TaxID=686340 RepID=H8GIT0_METAL|nr:sigma 54-interacting transcriptional regulator [Methylomicrobium album]EIC30270.1 transcriptional regulator containing PAS, AAA-type ATPase, and DNA-binding domains [Methylomicrobium album BG8]